MSHVWNFCTFLFAQSMHYITEKKIYVHYFVKIQSEVFVNFQVLEINSGIKIAFQIFDEYFKHDLKKKEKHIAATIFCFT